MAKFCGLLGFDETRETAPGVWTNNDPVERVYVGDILRHTKRWDSADQLNDDLNLNNQVSIVADEFAYSHCHLLKYVVINGIKWKVKDIEIQRPRLILSIGGVYNA